MVTESDERRGRCRGLGHAGSGPNMNGGARRRLTVGAGEEGAEQRGVNTEY